MYFLPCANMPWHYVCYASRAVARREELGYPLEAFSWGNSVQREFTFIKVANSVGSTRFAEAAAICRFMLTLRAQSEIRMMEMQHAEQHSCSLIFITFLLSLYRISSSEPLLSLSFHATTNHLFNQGENWNQVRVYFSEQNYYLCRIWSNLGFD